MNLAMEKRVLTLLLLMFGAIKLSIGAVHKVGDSAGWTTIGNVDYKKWASTQSFNVGDTILFVYNSQFHNVMQVTHDKYKSCNTSAPIATRTTGNDSFTLTASGHHYFLCGVPGHCQSGQKVDINVQHFSVLAPGPAPAPSPTAATVPAPSSSAAAPLYGLRGLFCELGLAMAILAAYVHGFA